MYYSELSYIYKVLLLNVLVIIVVFLKKGSYGSKLIVSYRVITMNLSTELFICLFY